MMRALALALLLASTACVAGPVPEHGGDGHGCDAAKAKKLIGRPASSEVAAEAQRLARADMVRWLRPGQIVTMEYREGRLNLKLDAEDRVEAITCG